ncbi:(2Fe-2S)-binding protein [Geothrix sp. PMB-07]|uniref:(2Fe-2S)-binding protein n=1 Tax=Geothrix sp. PMB-07 TaxID=3068640 RepID=UPI0027416F16|nr:(2Fe-2S)-binding protein [Geothrix sp. PMB-07]WLT33296.1 (2Fe-2S)-binding protein [Geothrix sp. PMB-07]
MAPIQLTVNGRVRTVDADGDTPLLWILRDTLGLTGTKFGCGQGVCGSCTVHLDGKAVKSCQTSLKEAAGRAIVTVEGLSKDGSHPVQKAWIAEDVAQCGYCQPGFIMSAAALLKRKPHPTDRDIDEAFADHVCRCGTYPRVRKAVKRAAGGVK